MAQEVLQAGLASGLSATSGFHEQKPPPVPQSFDQSSELMPSGYVPSKDTLVTYRGKKGDVKTAPISIGAWPWGDTATWHWSPEELPAVKAGWKSLHANGINHIDTAQVYGTGESERICGELVKGMKRDDFVMQTKMWTLATNPQNLINWNTAPYVKLKESLERFGLDYVDVYMVHGHNHMQSIATIAKSLAQCVDEGLTKTVAVGNYSKDDMLKMQAELAKYDVPLACNQCEYNILRREPEISGLLRACKENNIVFQAYSSLAQGRLTGKYHKDNQPPSSYRFSNYPMEMIDPTLDVLKKIASARGKPVAAVSLNYALVHGIVPVVGTRSEAQAESNAQALGWRLSDEEIKQIDAVSFQGKTTVLWQQG